MQMLQVDEVARRLNLAPGKVRQLFVDGRLPGQNVGTGRRAIWMIADEVLESWMRCEPASKQPQVETVKRGRRGRIDRDVPKVF